MSYYAIRIATAFLIATTIVNIVVLLAMLGAF